ncbi:hypothetical protein [Ferrimonas sp. YFM]|uniref:hypothetical protein n=1 Tax=Ferrimonas sp. YFM TaxID=3028878 RepID=UPI0025724F5C|nr:hypothetical protein [Ferrimonas sp. YFM]BDY03616.1 hypothetical protein F0521_06570 [Ferrimonas sp. YFM]
MKAPTTMLMFALAPLLLTAAPRADYTMEVYAPLPIVAQAQYEMEEELKDDILAQSHQALMASGLELSEQFAQAEETDTQRSAPIKATAGPQTLSPQ